MDKWITFPALTKIPNYIKTAEGEVKLGTISKGTVYLLVEEGGIFAGRVSLPPG